jgi:uncharacterized protein (TIGR02147 family)
MANCFRDILKEELAKRCAANPRYSLRAFARDLEMSPSRISQILNNRLGLSTKAARELVSRLDMSPAEADHFCKLVQANDSRSLRTRDSARAALDRYKDETGDYLTLQMDAFQMIADWYHYALLELLKTKGAKSDHKWLSRRLGISVYETEMAVERLKRLEFLEEKKGKLVPVLDRYTTGTDVPSEAIRSFHKQLLTKAAAALEAQNIGERDITTVTAPVAVEDLPEYKRRIAKFRREMAALFAKRAANATEVYCLGFQFFRLSEKTEER